MLLYEYEKKPFWRAVSYFSSEHLNLLCREYDDLISRGEILPHSSEGRSLLKTSVSNVKDMNEAQVRQSFVLPLLELLGWINQESEMHPVLKNGIIQFQFVHIHPFVDGNGRTSRLLCTFYLYKSGYDFKKLFSISEYYDKDRQNFYKAIQSVRENNMDMTSWLDYFVKSFLFQMNEVMEVGKKVILKDVLIENYSLSQRQGVIIEHILENEKLLPKNFDNLCTKMELVKKASKEKLVSKITKRTLQRDLKDMIDKKILKSEGRTNNKSYRFFKKL